MKLVLKRQLVLLLLLVVVLMLVVLVLVLMEDLLLLRLVVEVMEVVQMMTARENGVQFVCARFVLVGHCRHHQVGHQTGSLVFGSRLVVGARKLGAHKRYHSLAAVLLLLRLLLRPTYLS